MTKFIENDLSLETSWRSIILLGANVASYKFSLAKTLLEIESDKSSISINKLSLPFAKNICSHLKKNPKQITSRTSTFLDYCKEFNEGKITEEQLLNHTKQLGFENVIDCFHNVKGAETKRFFDDKRSNSNSIILTDNFYNLKESFQNTNFLNEIEARWRLWETAISLKINPNLLKIHADKIDENNDFDFYIINDDAKRKDVSSAKDALIGYQKGKCFYCFDKISVQSKFDNLCDTDHFFPHKLRKLKPDNKYFCCIDEVWNLVLACKQCNRWDKSACIPDFPRYLERLNKRNNYYIDSHHPLRDTIIKQTGNTKKQRERFLKSFDNEAIDQIPVRWKPDFEYDEGF